MLCCARARGTSRPPAWPCSLHSDGWQVVYLGADTPLEEAASSGRTSRHQSWASVRPWPIRRRPPSRSWRARASHPGFDPYAWFGVGGTSADEVVECWHVFRSSALRHAPYSRPGGRVLFATFRGASQRLPPHRSRRQSHEARCPSGWTREGRLVVTGWAAPSDAGDAALAKRRAGPGVGRPRGGFRIKAHVAEAGRKRLSLVAGGIENPARRRSSPAATPCCGGDVTFGNGVGRMIGLYGTRYPWLSGCTGPAPGGHRACKPRGSCVDQGHPVPNKEFHFAGPPAALAAAGASPASTWSRWRTTTRSITGGSRFLDTLRCARRYGIRTVGGGAELARANARQSSRSRHHGAFLGYSDVRPSGSTPDQDGQGPRSLSELIAADVHAAASEADVVVVYFTLGYRADLLPAARQRSLARVSFGRRGAGRTRIAPSRSAAPRAVRHRFVAWSIGNLSSGTNSAGTERTGILRLELGRHGVLGYDSGARIVQYQPNPVSFEGLYDEARRAARQARDAGGRARSRARTGGR